MDNAISNGESRVACLLCENKDIKLLEKCYFCEHVWYCTHRHDNRDKNAQDVSETDKEINGLIINNEHDTSTHNAVSENMDDAGITNKKETSIIGSHAHPHRPYGLNYCLPFNGM